jgi:CheY-like chemotaxis protein
VHDGETALQNIETYHPDLLVLDVPMLWLDGREVLCQLRQSGN